MTKCSNCGGEENNHYPNCPEFCEDPKEIYLIYCVFTENPAKNKHFKGFVYTEDEAVEIMRNKNIHLWNYVHYTDRMGCKWLFEKLLLLK